MFNYLFDTSIEFVNRFVIASLYKDFFIWQVIKHKYYKLVITSVLINSDK